MIRLPHPLPDEVRAQLMTFGRIAEEAARDAGRDSHDYFCAHANLERYLDRIQDRLGIEERA